MTYAEYIKLCEETQKENPSWRWGQTCFNVLVQVRSDLSEQVRATPLDPFYRRKTSEIKDFFEFVHNNW